MAQIIRTDGTVIEVQPKNGTDFQLDELQAIVGGCIEIILFIVPLDDDRVMVVNEEGKFICEPNAVATTVALAHKAILPNDSIHGNVLVCKSNLIK